MELGINHFLEVQQLIWDARSSYQGLAYALGLLPGDVSAITRACCHVTDDCFNDVLTEVLKKGVAQEELARALEHKTLGFEQLAMKVRAATFSGGPDHESPTPTAAQADSTPPQPGTNGPDTMPSTSPPQTEQTDSGPDRIPHAAEPDPIPPQPDNEPTPEVPASSPPEPDPTPSPPSPPPPQPTDPPKIIMNPTCQPKRIKQEAVLIVKASGSGTLSYCWVKDGSPITDEAQFGCTGATTNSLKFASLQPEHSGNYKCVVSCGGHSIDSKTVEVQVISTMKFKDFIQQKSEHQDGITVISDALKERFEAYLHECGYTYHDDRKLEDIFEKILANAKVNYDDATIDFQSLTQVVEPRGNIGESVQYANNKTEDQEHQFNRTVEYSVGSESSKEKIRGWSLSGGLDGTYQGVGANSGATYSRSLSETRTETEGTIHTHTFDEPILVPSESKVTVTVRKQIKVFNCQIHDLLITFPRGEAKFNCMIQFGQKRKNKKEEFKLKYVFKDDADVKSNSVTIRMGGKYIWYEPSVYIDTC